VGLAEYKQSRVFISNEIMRWTILLFCGLLSAQTKIDLQTQSNGAITANAPHAGDVAQFDGLVWRAIPMPAPGTTSPVAPITFLSGLGIMTFDLVTPTTRTVQIVADTAVMATHGSVQGGGPLLCDSKSAGSTYTCEMMPTLTAYTRGMVVRWIPDRDVIGPATLNIDTLGAAAVKLSDGLYDPVAGDYPTGQMRQVWFDGKVWRKVQ
jgi:hypothetical protein